ncbi:MAG: CvpA family protein [Pseudomonadales bacterium]|nr:CvpA family protein [Halieaceae bacterium]MCP5163992.1 CvpA family protein [Pseudomonadales bacterium]MCP5188972.1 CvpA family protein [Pseudomonadales bacterium]MCP5203041.1 CvpA family protein [Pseudomonadales bacterium]
MFAFSQFGAVDWVIVVVMTLSVLLSLWRGFAREALSLAGWVAAFLIANLFVDQMAALLAGAINNITGRYVAAYAILFVGTLVASTLATYLVAQLVRATGLSLLDRLLGTVFGFARGVILILVCVFVLRQLVAPTDLQWLDHSQLMPHIDMFGRWARSLFNEAGGELPRLTSATVIAMRY